MQATLHAFIVWTNIYVYLVSSKNLNYLHEDVTKLLSRREAVFKESVLVTIEEQAKKLPLDRFLEDQIVTQTFDKGKTTSTYTSPTDSSVSFLRNSYDSGVDTIVLSEDDDKLPQTLHQIKRIYIVLKKISSTKKSPSAHYFIFYAYLRDAVEGESDAIEIDNKKYLIEWDSWDNRSHQSKSKLLGWLNCQASVFFSCKINETSIAEFEAKTVVKEGRLMKRKKEFTEIVVEGFDADEFYALYGDYDETTFEAEQLGRSIFSVKSGTMCDHCKESESLYKPPKLASSIHENSLNFGRTLGMFFEGPEDSSTAIFIPHNKGLTSMFAPDAEDTHNMPLIHGMLYSPPDVITPLTFISDKKSMVKNLRKLKGTMVPDDMTDKAMEGGIHGSLSETANGAVFIPELLPTNLYLHPKNIDPEKVFFPASLMKPPPEKLAAEDQGEKNGVLFAGLQGHLDIFVPSGSKIDGYFSPDETNVELEDALHGSLIPQNETGISIFEIEIKGPQFQQAYGSFIPDDMPSSAFILGSLLKVDNTLTFTPKTQAKSFIYDPSDIVTAHKIWVASSNAENSSAPILSTKQDNNGTLFDGNPPIFFQQNNPMNGFLILDSDNSEIHGKFTPSIQSPKFSADVPLENIEDSSKCRFIPDKLHSTNKGGEKLGIMGTFFHTNGSFVANIPGKNWNYDPQSPSEGVWTPTVIDESKDDENRRSPPTIDLPGGIFYRGKAEKYGIFIPENEGVPGIIVPDKTMFAPMKGVFYAGEMNQPATFYLQNPRQITKSITMAATFSADGIAHPAQGIKGISTSILGSREVSFIPDVPCKSYIFDPNDSENSQVWTPYIPGITLTTEKYDEIESEEVDASASLYGHLFSEIGADDGIFLPFDVPVVGTIIFANRKYPKIPGKLIVRNNGKSPEYFPDNSAAASALFNVRGIFMPDGLPRIFAGVRGFFTAGIDDDGGTFRTDVNGEFHVYSPEKDEENGIWKPPELAKIESIQISTAHKNGPTAATAMLKPFVQGAYFHGEHSGTFFISTDGKLGVLTDSTKNTKYRGVLYPEEPPKFVSDDKLDILNMSAVKFIIESSRGEQANSLLGSFVPATSAEPASILPSKSYIHGWTNFRVSNPASREHHYVFSNNKWTNNFKAKESRILKNGIVVGGGYKGYETQGKSFDGLMDANSPTFKEFLESRASISGRESGKYSEIPMNLFLATSDDKNKFGSVGNIETINASDYLSWLKDNYMITKTQISTHDINATVEIAVPISAKEYLKIKGKKKKFNVIIETGANAGAGVGASGGGSGSARGGVTTQIGNCKATTTSAQATALSTSGGTAQAQSSAKQGGQASSVAKADNGAKAIAKSEIENTGVSNSKATASNGGKASSLSSSIGGGVANAVANSQRGKEVAAKANAKSPLRNTREIADKSADSTGKDCQDDFVDEIVVESSAVANAMAAKDNPSGSSASANTQVRVNLAGLVAKMMSKQEENDDDDDAETVDIHINANSMAHSGRALKKLPIKGKVKKPAKINDKPGWKTEFREVKENITLLNEDAILFGFGSCPYQKTFYSQLQTTVRPEEIIEFYLNVMKTGCINKEKMRTLMLVVDGLLEFDEKTLVIPSSHTYRKERKLTAGEMNSFSRAFELSMFTKTYIYFGENQDSNSSEPLSPDGTPISRSIRFITEWTLISIDERMLNFPTHLVRLTRNNIVTLRTVLTKLNLDRRRLTPCKECVLDMEINYYDCVQVTALLHFLIHGLAPVAQGSVDPRTAFNTFYVKNKAALKERADHAYAMLN